ncbi:MAG: ribosomal protein S18-alanine N-acetyltransferase [Acidobacteriota bacterium]|nr:ribosomal protein S18-alanine N-acetyltransferase [Acidobacteriota bacterium]
MAVLQKIRELFISQEEIEPETIVPAPPTVYEIRPLTDVHLKEVLKLNLRCFREGENYTKHTFAYLLSEPRCLSYRIITPNKNIVGFIFIMIGDDGTGHITTIGIAPEHRRRGLADKLLNHAENALRARDINTVRLEVRVENFVAQALYRRRGYAVLQKLFQYYNNGEDGFLMVKSL